jgi:hypothetical protein
MSDTMRPAEHLATLERLNVAYVEPIRPAMYIAKPRTFNDARSLYDEVFDRP